MLRLFSASRRPCPPRRPFLSAAALPVGALVLVAPLRVASCAPPAPAPSTSSTTTQVPVPVPALVFPVDGRSSWAATFGAPRSGGRTHEGEDVFAARGTPVVAATSGTVTTVSRGQATLAGNYVGVSSDSGWRTLYMHLNNDSPGTDDGRARWDHTFAPGVVVGQRVVAGQLLGFLGDSGNAEGTAPHLHFEVRRPVPGSSPVPVPPATALRAAARTRLSDAQLAAAAPQGVVDAVVRVASPPTTPTVPRSSSAPTTVPVPHVAVAGWSVDRVADAPPLVVVTVDGQPAGQVRPTLPRPDLARAFPSRRAAMGFITVVPARPGARVCALAGAVRGGGVVSLGCRTAP